MNPITVELPTLGELPKIAAENNPHVLAFADEDESVTWGEFEERSLLAADAFADHVRQGDRVAILSHSSVATTVAWSGALKAGAIVSFVHSKAAPETVRYSIDELRPEVLVVHEDLAGFLVDRVWADLREDPTVVVIGEPTTEFDRSLDSFLAGAEAKAPDVLLSEDDVAIVAWTSGTTGTPKGWCHTHRSVMLKGLRRRVDRGIKRLSSTSTSFMAWYASVLPPMLAGGSVIYLPDWDPKRWAVKVEEYEITHAGMVPTMWRAVLDLDLSEYDFSSLERITFVGEKMDRATLDRLRAEVCENVVNAYSSTELTIALNTAEEMSGERIESVGKPSGGTRVRIVEPDGDPNDVLPPGEPGEIIVKGADAPVWAWGDTATATSAFRNGWWFSGDMGYKDEEGYLFLEGRKDFMIKSKGVKVFPAPIEDRLNDHAGVSEAVVVGIEDEEFGQKVTAVVKRSDEAVTAETLDAWCLDTSDVARFERPREYVFVDESLPRTPSRKLDRKTVIERLDAG